jgi:hypothetical protein
MRSLEGAERSGFPERWSVRLRQHVTLDKMGVGTAMDSASGDRLSTRDVVYAVMREAEEPLTFEQVFERTAARCIVNSRNPRATVRGALSQGKQLFRWVTAGTGICRDCWRAVLFVCQSAPTPRRTSCSHFQTMDAMSCFLTSPMHTNVS